MMAPTICRAAVLLASLGAAPRLLAQTVIGPPEQSWPFIALIVGFAMLIPIAIVAIINLGEWRQNRDRLALVERLFASGHTVPPELLRGGDPAIALPEERRRDVRRGITLTAWAIAVALIPIIGSGGEWRYGVWGLLFLLPALGSFLKAHLTAREIARGAANGALHD